LGTGGGDSSGGGTGRLAGTISQVSGGGGSSFSRIDSDDKSSAGTRWSPIDSKAAQTRRFVLCAASSLTVCPP
jgi:hypothetical protein